MKNSVRFTQICLVLTLFSLTANAQNLQLEKRYFNIGEPIRIKFVAQPNFDNTAWIGVIPSEVRHGDESLNDMYDISYVYLEGQTSGEVILQAPEVPGNYDIRMHNKDSGGAEVASASFETRGALIPRIYIGKTDYYPGERMILYYSKPASYSPTAWIGIVPSDVSHGDEIVNDKYDLQYRTLYRKHVGKLEFLLPAQPGSYDLRMNDDDNGGSEVIFVSFKIISK